jgi:retron-type reverse transcriptase
MNSDEKARLYKEILERTSDAVMLQRMRVHGFWPQREGLPADPAEEAAERARIEAELAELRRLHAQIKDPDAALAEERTRRWEASKARRAARKKERQAELTRRRAEWAEHRRQNVVHVGEGHSGGLQHRQSDRELLTHFGLPPADNAAELAKLMGLELKRLRWLTYHRKGAAVVHYHRYEIAKKTGGVRCISAPKRALAGAQQWVLSEILLKLPIEPEAHGFVTGRGIVSNATPHVGKQVVINMDLRDFFPTVTYRRVKGLFHSVGYSEQVATVLALLVTEPPRVATELDGRVYFVALGQRVLPQGACASPAITNLLCRRMDRRLAGLAGKHGYVYTRYADDLTLSGENPRAIGKLLKSVRSVVESEGFTEHPRKTRVMRRSNRQEVTGLTVNVRPKVSRSELRELRAILHNAARKGMATQNRNNHPDFAAYLRGRVEFVCMADPARAADWRERLNRALAGPG